MITASCFLCSPATGIKHSIEEIAEYIGVDSLAYLSTEGLYRAVESTQDKYCDACFSGNCPAGTPVQIKPKRQQMLFERD